MTASTAPARVARPLLGPAMKAKHTHYLLVGEWVGALDVPSLRLTLMSRGRRPVGRCPERDRLAAILGGGALAELLASDAPIRADSVVGAYLFEQV